jgi:transposase
MNFREKLGEAKEKELGTFIEDKKRTRVELERAQGILLLEAKVDDKIIQDTTGFTRRSLVRLRKKYIKYGITALEDKRKKKENRSLLTKKEREQVYEIVYNKKPKDYGRNADFWTPAILGEVILEVFGVKYKSKTSLYLIFRRAKLSFKKPEKVYKKRDQKVIDAWKEQNMPEIMAALNDENTVVLSQDEMVVVSETTTQRVWIPRDKEVIIECSNVRKRRCFYGFTNIKTGEQHAFKSERMTSEITAKFLKQVLKIYKGKKILLLWDNASWHFGQAMRDFLATINNLRIINYPTYSPDLNPQEHVWKAVRANITHNKYIADIDKIARDILMYLNNTNFKYELLGFRPQ